MNKDCGVAHALTSLPTKSCASDAVAAWASRINTAWGRGTDSTLELAKEVQSARRTLPYGDWTRLWKSGGVGFSKRKGEMLVVIGRNLDNLDAQTSAHLPAGWNALYHLALLDRATLEREIAAGTIHPGMTLHQAKALLAKFRGQAENRCRKPNVAQRLENIEEFLDSTAAEWPPEDLELAGAKFLQFADKVRGQGGDPQSVRPSHSPHPRCTTAVSFPG